MKTVFCILAFLIALSVAPARSAETNIAVQRVEREMLDMDAKMIDIRIKLLLAQYEKIEKQLMDWRFEEAVSAGQQRTEEQKKEDSRRSRLEEVLASESNRTVAQLRDLAQQRGKLTARRETAKKQQ